MALLINNESPQNIIYNGNEVLKVVYNDVIVWEKQSEQQMYQRRIIVGDNLDNRTLYFDFPDDYVPVTTGTEGYAFISGDWSSIWEQPYGDDPMDTDILISGMGLLRTIYEPKKPSEKLTETQIGNEEIGEIYSIEDANASYRHCYIEDSNIRPIQVGDRIVAGTKIYFTYPDNYYNQWAADGTYNDAVLIQLGINEEDVYKSFYHARYSSGAMSVSLDFFDSFSGSSKYIYDTDDSGNVLTNISYVEFTQDEGEVTFVDPYNFEKIIKHILVDTTTLGE